jgi:plasmid stability protein
MLTNMWYCEHMANITVTVPDEVYRRARVKAAEQSTSVSALVRQFLTDLAGAETEFERLKRMQNDVLHAVVGFSAGDRLSRDELYGQARRPVR